MERTGVLVPVEEYLNTTYHPDCEYVDGVLVERNVGDRYHSSLQGEVYYYFRSRIKQWRAHAFVELRIQVSSTHFRIPDICVVLGDQPTERILRTPPFICIEVLSPDDTVASMQGKIDDYLTFGVPNVWVIDPVSRRAWTHTTEGAREIKDGILRTENPALVIPLSEIFANVEP